MEDNLEREPMTLEQIEESLEDGVLLAIIEQTELLNNLLKEDELSKNELIRVVKNIASFPSPIPPNKGMETRITHVLYTIKDLQVEQSIINIAKQQQEQEEGNE